MNRVFLLGPSLTAVSGVSTHVSQLLSSSLAREFDLTHFKVGREGRSGGRACTLVRAFVEPLALFAKICISRPRIVHINTSLVPRSVWRDIAYLFIGKLLRTKIVLQIHGGSLTFLAAHHKLATWFYRTGARLADAIVVLSSREVAAHEIMRVGRPVLIPNAINVGDYVPACVKSYEVGLIRIVFLGRLHPDKGLFDAIESMRMVLEQGIVDFSFHVAGIGPAAEELKQRVRQYQLQSHVVLEGLISGKDKLRFWCDAGIHLLPSHHEGLPYALLEAMASGTPTIATNVGAIPDVMENGVHGLLVPARDPSALAHAIATLLRNRSMLGGMSRACLERATKCYGLERLVTQVGKVYSDLIGGRFRRPPEESKSAMKLTRTEA